MKKRVTLKDIAHELNVSVNTVSHALRDLPDIGSDLKKKIVLTSKKMGYIHNSAASGLRFGKSNLIAIVFDNLLNQYYSVMADYLSKNLSEQGYNVIIVPCQGYIFGNKFAENIIEKNVDGIISFLSPDDEAINICCMNHVPLIIIGRHCYDERVSCFYSDDNFCGFLAAKFLLKHGVKKPLFVGPLFLDISHQRYDGFNKVFAENSIETKFISVDNEAYDYEKVNIEISKLKIDGIFCFNDAIANKVISELPSKKLVVGCDNVCGEIGYGYKIPSVSFSYKDLCIKVSDLIVAKIHGKLENPKEIIPIFLDTKN